MSNHDPAIRYTLHHPSALAVAAIDDEAFANRTADLREEYPEATIWTVRGAKARTVASMFDEVAAALQFPYYFGENWAALDDCLNDLDWSGSADHLLMITHAHLLLVNEPSAMLGALVESLVDAHEAWGRPNQHGDPGSFRTVLQVPPEAESALWARLVAVGAADSAT